MTGAGRIGEPTLPVHRFSLATTGVVLTLIAAAYVGASHHWVIWAACACAALACWITLAVRQPRTAVAGSIAMLLLAGTKFRLRDATDSLAGVIDWQIGLELGLFAAIGAAVVALAFTHEMQRSHTRRPEWLLLAYAMLALVSVTWSDAPTLTLVRSLQLVVVTALAIVTVRLLGPSRTIWTASRVLAMYVLACALSTAIVATDTTFDSDHGAFRFAWFAVHPIAAGTLAAIAALAMLSPSFFGRAGAHRVLGLPRWIVAGALIAVLALTSARGPLLAFAAACAVLLLMRLPGSIRSALAISSAIGLLLYFVSGADYRDWLTAAAASDSLVARTFFRGQSASTLLSLNGRLELWNDLSPVITTHPIAGLGFQASRAAVLETAPWAAYAHNAFLQAMLDLGVAGTVLVALLVAVAFSGSLATTHNPWLRATLAAVMVFLTVNSVSTESFTGPPGFETLLLMLAVLCAVPNRGSAEGHDR